MRTNSNYREIEITCISDTHCAEVYLEEGDILIHAGDLTYQGKLQETVRQLDWIARQKFRHKIIVPGNHERGWEQGRIDYERLCYERGIQILNDSSLTVMGIKLYGSPITPKFYDWAWMREPGEEIEQVWKDIPEGIDILVTHGPPYGILDKNSYGEHCGCNDLLKHVKRVKPKLHVFGHIHEGYGQTVKHGIRFINAAIMDGKYQPINMPTRLVMGVDVNDI